MHWVQKQQNLPMLTLAACNQCVVVTRKIMLRIQNGASRSRSRHGDGQRSVRHSQLGVAIRLSVRAIRAQQVLEM